MNAYAERAHLRDLRLRALCLAIGIVLALPVTALAQDDLSAQQETAEQQTEANAPTAQDAPTQDAPTEDAPTEDDPFALEETTEAQSDPAKLEALTQVQSTVEVGAIYTSDDSFRFGRYNGLEEEGLSPLLNLDVFRRGAYDGDSARYWRLQGRNLGLDSREASAEFGVQGRFGVRIGYDELPAFRSDSARTIFDGAGSGNLTLPADWVGSGSTAGMTQLLPSLKPLELRTERRKGGISVTGVLSPRWEYSANYQHESKEGIKSIGGVFGNSGGNPRAVILPEPVDYTTQQMDLALRYTTRKLQVEAAYYLSLFSEDKNALVWANPYTQINGWGPGSGFPDANGQLSLPPDNRFHQFSLNTGYNFSDKTRLTATVARGRMTQDDTFLPFTSIPELAASITQPLPRTSLDGRIDTTVVNLRIASRPWPDFSWNAGYRYDDRDNKTPRDEYVYIGGDTQLQQTELTSNRRRFNQPYSYREQEYKAEANYQVFQRTGLSAGVQHNEIDRTFSEREQADETTYRFGINTDVSERFNGQLRYTHGEREGSTYVGNAPFLNGYSPGYTSTVPGNFENLPGLRKYYLADRDRDQLSLNASFMPTEAWTLSAALDYAEDDYNESELGLVNSTIDTFSFETVYAPSPLWSTHAFYTNEELESDQNGRSFSNLITAFDPANDWFVDHRDSIDTYGAGYKRTLAAGRLDLGIDYLYSKTRSDLDFTVGSALTTAPLPRSETKLESLNLNFTYRMRPNTSLRLGYWYERYDSTDWAVDGILPNQLANVILLGEDSPDYDVHVVSLSLLYRF